jgi:hypothetical protein
LDVGDAVGMKSGRGRKDDEKRNQVGKAHADDRVGSDAGQLRPCIPRRDAQRFDVTTVLFFHLLPALPKEQIGGDGRPQNGDQSHRLGAIEAKAGDERPRKRGPPGDTGAEDDSHISEERQGQPFQRRGVSVVSDYGFQNHAEHAEHRGVEMLRPPNQQCHRRAHGAKIGRQIDDVGDHQQHDNGA